MKKEYQADNVNVKSVKVVILALIFVLFCFWLVITATFEILAMEMPQVAKIIIALMAIEFIYSKIIVRASGYLVKVFAAMGSGTGFFASFGEAIPKEEEEKAKN